MNHGKATVEHAFSVNRQLMTDNTNICERIILAKRLINVYIPRVGGVKNIIITGGLLARCTQTPKNYMLYFEKTRDETKQKEKCVLEDDALLRLSKLKQLESDIAYLTSAADKHFWGWGGGENVQEWSWILEANAFRKRSKKQQMLLGFEDRINKYKIQKYCRLPWPPTILSPYIV